MPSRWQKNDLPATNAEYDKKNMDCNFSNIFPYKPRYICLMDVAKNFNITRHVDLMRKTTR